MNTPPSLEEQDVRAVVRLLGNVASKPGDHAEKKRELMAGLCALIDADRWAWGVARDVEPDEPSVHVSLLHGGFTDETYAMFSKAYLHPDMSAAHAPFVAEMKRRGHLTRLRQQIDPERLSWTNGAGPFWEKADIDGVIFSIYPNGRDFLSLIGIYRRISAPLFSERDSLLAHILLGAVAPLHYETLPTANGAIIPRLSPRQRMTLEFLVQGNTRAQIASFLEISIHTANEYVKAVFSHFGVHSQASLIARFRTGDGGDR